MSKFRVSIIAVFTALLAALAIAVPALADPVTPNSASTQIPVKLDINAGSSYDLSDITYQIGIAGKTYSAALPTNVREYPSTSTISNTPITIDLGTTAPTSSTDIRKSWSANWTLAQLFGDDPTVNFPDAGMYEFDITATHTGDETADWNYTLPSYKLQVLIKNNANMTGREYGGWVLTNDAGDKISNNNENDPSDPALFFATNKATGTLNVTKQVSGNYASTTHAFEQTITLMLPEWAKTAVITATDPADRTLEGISSNEGIIRTYTVNLAHNQTATFEDVPVGTRYSVVETTGEDGKAVDAASLKYNPSIQWSVAEGSSSSLSLPPHRSGLSEYSLDELKQISADLSAKGDSSEFYTEFAGYLANDDTYTVQLVLDGAVNYEGTSVFEESSNTFANGSLSADDKNMELRIIGINHDDKADDSGKAGLTFMAKHVLPISYRMNPPVDGNAYNATNVGGWAATELRDRMNPGGDTDLIWNMIPETLQSAITPVKKVSGNNAGSMLAEAVTTSNDYLFCLSLNEIMGGDYISTLTNWNGNSFPDYQWLYAEGSRYAWFVQHPEPNLNSIQADSPLDKILQRSFIAQGDSGYYSAVAWERTSNPNTSESFLNWGTTPIYGNNGDPAGDPHAVAFAFCI